jgi:maltose/moltooligosaccharide transporter
VTFGWVYENLLGDNPNNAIRFAAVFLGIAGLLMLWIKEPPIIRDVDDVAYLPAGH